MRETIYLLNVSVPPSLHVIVFPPTPPRVLRDHRGNDVSRQFRKLLTRHLKMLKTCALLE